MENLKAAVNQCFDIVVLMDNGGLVLTSACTSEREWTERSARILKGTNILENVNQRVCTLLCRTI